MREKEGEREGERERERERETQATENAVGFYESLGFVRVGAIAAVRPEPVTASKVD
jgi:ribosomal protein S18 acetylase RimI-like enzyme